MNRLTILGATGSIGVNTLDVVARHPDRFEVVALTGHRRIDLLETQCRQFSPRYAVVGEASDATRLTRALCGQKTEVLFGPEALAEVAALPEVGTVMAAIVGAAGLQPTLAAVRAGKKVLLANKEALVMAGGLFMAEVQRSGAVLLPIDSEHNAVFQALPSGQNTKDVDRILLTASGGPFRTTALEQMASVTPDEACAHPQWVMGRKISVDSATMMNKGLEVIEARWLFDMPAERIDVVIHPQSIIHSMVQYVDGSVLAQMGNPDMRTPIAHALAWPERMVSGVAPLDLFQVAQLNFERPDLTRFPCLSLAYQALSAGGNAATVLNAANEVAVAAFLSGRLPFLHIAQVIRSVLETMPSTTPITLEDVLVTDTQARQLTEQCLP